MATRLIWGDLSAVILFAPAKSCPACSNYTIPFCIQNCLCSVATWLFLRCLGYFCLQCNAVMQSLGTQCHICLSPCSSFWNPWLAKYFPDYAAHCLICCTLFSGISVQLSSPEGNWQKIKLYWFFFSTWLKNMDVQNQSWATEIIAIGFIKYGSSSWLNFMLVLVILAWAQY